MAGVRERRLLWGLAALSLALAVAAYLHFDLGQYLTLETLQRGRGQLLEHYRAAPIATVAVYFAAYVAITALSIPGATILTLGAGAVFGLALGTVVVSFASSIGATLAFLLSRFLFHDAVQQRFGQRLRAINEGIRRDGVWYLLILRLSHALPFFLINLLAGLTPLPARRFYWVSQLGMLPATLVYVNAGTQLGRIRNLSDIFSPTVIGSFLLLALFPLLAKWGGAALRRRRLYARWPRPRHFDRNLVVIGAGAAGLSTAYVAAAAKAKVTLVEADRMGGDCLNSGCVPSKALLRSARLARQIRDAGRYGLGRAELALDFRQAMARVQRVIRAVEPHDSAERYAGLGVDVVQGEARLTSPWTVEIRTAQGRQTLSTRSIVIATGAAPRVPPIPGLDAVRVLTSDTVWSLQDCPGRLVVLGGGPLGCELAQAFARLGAEVTQVEQAERLMGREDADAAALVAQALQADGVTVLTGHAAQRCERQGEVQRLVLKHAGGERTIEFDAILCAVGRVPRTEGLGLEALGIELTEHGTIAADGALRTRYPNILVCGDVAGPFQFTHVAGHQGWHAAVNALFGWARRLQVDYRVLPWTTFTDPEVARVGLSEDEARRQGVAYQVTRFDLGDLDRAITDEATRGFVKVLTVPGKDRILGVTIVGEHAGEMLPEYVLAMKHGLGLAKILGTLHVYPTLSEANRHVAGRWRQAHLPPRLLAWSERIQAWRRRDRKAAPDAAARKASA